ncbi:unnamed protein product [Brachionus calyciflorus]|uniref:Sec16 Sec23-binding domain-containing protein n=1 Tax=Brachionus calyciflorus TaxID=104777 RepID=A0A813M0M8_9BILA|nr:unnamed protein product [Brachionus calyciflorus]
MNQNIKSEDTPGSVSKNNDSQPKYPPPPRSISGRSTASFNPNIQPPMQQPPFMPPPLQLDWNMWNPYQYGQAPGITNPSPFDVGFKDEMTNQALNQKAQGPTKSTTIQQLKQPSGVNQMQSQMPNQMAPFMDPSYMYYMMAAAAAAAYNPTPFGYPPYGGYPYQQPQMNQRYYPEDDRQSIKSFSQFDLDARSEKNFDPRTTRSIAGDHIKQQQQLPTQQGLLIPDQKITEELEQEMTQLNLNQTNLIKQEESVMKEPEKINRMTPQMHQLPHVRCHFSFNSLIRVRPNDPCDGQPTLVDIFNLSDFMENYLSNVKKSQNLQETENDNDEDYKHDLDDFNYMNDDVRNEILLNYKLLQEFPGPLCKEANTSKAQVIQFCLKNVKECLASNTSLIDPQSHALLWDFLALLVRQNGIIDLKTDISPLLLSGLVGNDQQQQQNDLKHSESTQSLNQQQDFVMVQQKENCEVSNSDEVNLNRLRQLLGAGQKSDAIEYTIKHNMWPHALFLASSTYNSSSQTQTINDTKTTLSNTNLNLINNSPVINESKMLSKVKLRFISSLPQNDPILTCYQLLMGRVPTAASNLSKSEWNEWRRHLAMIVSNVDDSNRNLVLNTIKTMGDSLASNGRIAASHFCYLLSNCTFGTFNKKSSKLVLIGSSHNQDFNKFCQISAIQATEIFEYAQSLLPSATSQFNSDNFLKYKLIYANRLLEHGLVNEAYKYIEIIAKTLNKNPNLHTDKISSVYHLANRLKAYDPDYFNFEETSLYQEPLFMNELTQNYRKIYSKNISHLIPPENESSSNDQKSNENLNQNQQIQEYNNFEPKLEQQSFVDNNNQYDQYQNQVQQPVYEQQIPNYYPQQNDTQSLQQQQVDHVDQMVNNQMSYQENNYYNQSNQQHIQHQEQQQSAEQTYQQQYEYTNNYQPQDYSQIDYQQHNQQQQQPQQSRKSSASSVMQSNNYPNEQLNYSTATGYYQPHTVARSRASSTSNTDYQQTFYEQQIPKSQTFHTNFYQPNYNENNGIAEESSTTETTPSTTDQSNYQKNNIEDNDDDLSWANPKPKIKQENNMKNEDDKDSKQILTKPEEKKGLLGWLGFGGKQAGPKKMILPDDKKKTIVWDDKLKKYVNKDSSGSESSEAVKPPPVSLPPTQPSLSQNTPLIPEQGLNNSNKFSLKSSNQKRPTNYYAKLDIMADKSKKLPSIPSGNLPPIEPQMGTGVPLLSNLPPPSQLPPRFFVPEPSSTQNQLQEEATPVQQESQYNSNYYQEQNQQQQQQQFYYNPSQQQQQIQDGQQMPPLPPQPQYNI